MFMGLLHPVYIIEKLKTLSSVLLNCSVYKWAFSFWSIWQRLQHPCYSFSLEIMPFYFKIWVQYSLGGKKKYFQISTLVYFCHIVKFWTVNYKYRCWVRLPVVLQWNFIRKGLPFFFTFLCSLCCHDWSSRIQREISDD